MDETVRGHVFADQIEFSFAVICSHVFDPVFTPVSVSKLRWQLYLHEGTQK